MRDQIFINIAPNQSKVSPFSSLHMSIFSYNTDILQSCWMRDPDERPIVRDVLRKLREFSSEVGSFPQPKGPVRPNFVVATVSTL